MKTNQILEEIKIKNPIGNLYRKKHVLILVVNCDGKFILGKKNGFYPDGISRLLGGGIDDGESPQDAAQREIKEELLIDLPVSNFIELCSVKTVAQTTEGQMEMETWIFFVRLDSNAKITASDDVSSLVALDSSEFEDLVNNIKNLSGEFITEKFSFLWSDWGKVYGPIHEYAIREFNKL
jgi:8-oxo-dGTP pyrophosphatase MutT (NUDIX family)